MLLVSESTLMKSLKPLSNVLIKIDQASSLQMKFKSFFMKLMVTLLLKKKLRCLWMTLIQITMVKFLMLNSQLFFLVYEIN